MSNITNFSNATNSSNFEFFSHQMQCLLNGSAFTKMFEIQEKCTEIAQSIINENMLRILETFRETISASLKTLQELVESIGNCQSTKVIQTFNLCLELPVFNTGIESECNSPNAPPGIIEIAIDNMKFNFNKMSSSKTFKFIKRHSVAISKTIIYKFITELIFN